MFDGSFRSSRAVDLSGRKKKLSSHALTSKASIPSDQFVSKQEFLSATRHARHQRQQLKLQSLAATKLQSLWRGRHARRTLRSSLRTQLQQEIATIVTQHPDFHAQPLPSHQLTKLVRRFVCSVGDQATSLRQVGDYLVCVLLVNCLSSAHDSPNLLQIAPKDASWVHQMSSLVKIFLAQVMREFKQPNANLPPTWMAPYVVFLELFTSKYDMLWQQDQTTRQRVVLWSCEPILEAFTNCVMQEQDLKRTPEHGSPDATNQRIVEVVEQMTASICRQVLATSGDQVSGMTRELVASKLLLCPGSINSPRMKSMLSKTRLDEHQVAVGLKSLVETLFARVDQHQMQTLSWQRVVFVGNTLELLASSRRFDQQILSCCLRLVAQWLTPAMVRWAFQESSLTVKEPRERVQLAVDSIDIDSVNVSSIFDKLTAEMTRYAAQIDQSLRQTMRNRALVGVDACIQSIRQQIQALCDESFARKCFDIALRQDSEPHDTIVCLLGQVYQNVLVAMSAEYVSNLSSWASMPPAKPVFTLLSALTTMQSVGSSSSQSVVGRLWDFVRGPLANSSSPAAPAHLNVLLLFNVLFSHMLLALDDETFYDRAWPLAKDQVSHVVQVLKQLIHDTCWSNTLAKQVFALNHSTSQPNQQDTLQFVGFFLSVASSIKLFNQLYDRDCRRRFTSVDAWLWPSAMPALQEMIDLESLEDDQVDATEVEVKTQCLFQMLWKQSQRLRLNNSTDQNALSINSASSASSSSSSSSTSLRSSMAFLLGFIPQVFSFDQRVALFEKLLEQEKTQRVGHLRNEFEQHLGLRISRGEIVDNAFEAFQQISRMNSHSLKSRMKVTFVNEQGLEEAGIDGGGVFKEFMDCLTKEAFSPEYAFFLVTDDQLLYPNPAARLASENVLDKFRFLGRVLGKAVYENILVEPQFAAFFLNKLLAKYNYIDDLQSLDPELYRHLMFLKHYEGDVEALALTFSVTNLEFGQVMTHDLIPNGASIAVTNDNRIRYIHLVANYRLNVQCSSESRAFLRGFRDLIPTRWIQLFSPTELQMLIGGTSNQIDVADWYQHTLYSGGYHQSQPLIQWFWEVVQDFDADQRAALLKFITSCSRQPLLGFKQLVPQLCIHQVRIDDDERLPSSATCMNLLKLPTYSSKGVMRRKLLYAIESKAGFDLS